MEVDNKRKLRKLNFGVESKVNKWDDRGKQMNSLKCFLPHAFIFVPAVDNKVSHPYLLSSKYDALLS